MGTAGTVQGWIGAFFDYGYLVGGEVDELVHPIGIEQLPNSSNER